jgi:hypothetical protein
MKGANKMSFEALPRGIFVEIYRKLDFTSQVNLSQTCRSARESFLYGVDVSAVPLRDHRITIKKIQDIAKGIKASNTKKILKNVFYFSIGTFAFFKIFSVYLEKYLDVVGLNPAQLATRMEVGLVSLFGLLPVVSMCYERVMKNTQTYNEQISNLRAEIDELKKLINDYILEWGQT